MWHDDFGDIDGWDLQHVQCMRWHWKCISGEPQVFKKYSLKWGATIHKMDNTEVLNWIRCEPANSTDQSAYLPSSSIPISDDGRDCETLANELHSTTFNEVIDYAGHLTAQGGTSSTLALLKEAHERAQAYRDQDMWPSEAEGIAHLVIPLLRALGWSWQQTAIEWDNMDLALFTGGDRNRDQVDTIIEAKRRGTSTLTARSQAEEYYQGKRRKKSANKKPLLSCHRIIVTDGIAYTIFERARGSQMFRSDPSAHLNLTRMRSSYPILGDNCGGAVEALKIMSPHWQPTG
jgi:hypothetical protein